MRATPPVLLPLLLLVVQQLPQLPGAVALTTPDQYARVTAFRDAMVPRSANWAAGLASWTCPTPAANSVGTCDPCGNSYQGNWFHMHCRGNTVGWGESGDGVVDGRITNMHITDVNLDGPVPRELRLFSHLREFDLDGGHLTGPIPRWFGDFPELQELDLSYNRLTGTLPPYLAKLPNLTEVKVEDNALIGTIPPEFGNTGMKLRRFQVELNQMTGPLPDSFKNVRPYLAQLHLAGNDFEGNLSALAGGHLTTVTVHDNPKLCGMVPATVRYAKNYNPANTRLGQPC